MKRTKPEEIKVAFKDAVYPGDDQIGHDEWQMWRYIGQKWANISLDLVLTMRHELTSFYPPGFAYFLPAFMLVAILPSDIADDLPDMLIDLLNLENLIVPPPEGDDWLIRWFKQFLACLSKAQIEVIRKYFVLYRELEPDASWSFSDQEDLNLDRGIEYWTRLATE